MTRYLVFSVGPVQDFIFTARTSQDLAYGSWMLSELAKAVARALSQAGAELVFPNPQDAEELSPNSSLNVANKVVVLTNDDVETLVHQAKDAMFQRLQALAEKGLQRTSPEKRKQAQRQIEDLIEWYWASAAGADKDYPRARALAEAALTARKNTRDFRPWPGKNEEKSSLDGYREGVYHGPKGRSTRELGEGEVLSAVDMVKRFGKISNKVSNKFLSTSDFAAAPFRRGLGSELDTALLQEWKDLLAQYTPEEETDGAYFFVERLTRFLERDQRDAFRKKYQTVLKQKDIRHRPHPYYALFKADGDGMGRVIDAQREAEAHRALSRAMSEFSHQARTIVQKHHGQAIFAGGDDILAYLPLDTALACIQELDQAFDAFLGNFKDRDDRRPTLSGGLVIAHHLTPLDMVLDAAQRAEHLAKDHPGKHALAILRQKRGGGEIVVMDAMDALLHRMNAITQWRLKGAIGQGAAYELRELADFLQAAGFDSTALREVFSKEALRILKRKRETGGGALVNEELVDILQGWLERMSVRDLAQEMIIATEFATARHLAQPQQEVTP